MTLCITGLTTVEEGSVDNNVISLKSTNIGRMNGGKDPQVLQVRNASIQLSVSSSHLYTIFQVERAFRLIDENTLEQELSMATSNTPTLTKHLKATYIRKMK